MKEVSKDFSSLTPLDSREMAENTYRNIYAMPKFSISVQVNSQLHETKRYTLNVNTSFYYERACYTLNSITNMETFYNSMGHVYLLVNLKNSVGHVDLVFVDSQSVHSMPTSSLELTSAEYRIQMTLRKSEYLEKPYQRDCVKESGYNQHNCYLNCLNNMIFKTFNCNLIYSSSESYICHPLLVPLIVQYKNLIKTDSTELNNECKLCKVPCEIYFYELEPTYLRTLSYNYIQIGVINDLYTITSSKEVALLTLKDCVIILMSYFSLYFGGSVLALIQIFYNYMVIVSLCNKTIQRVKLTYFKFIDKYVFEFDF